MQTAKLYIILYINNRYIDYPSLNYLDLALKSKIKCKYSTLLLRLSNIYKYNFESIVGVIKLS